MRVEPYSIDSYLHIVKRGARGVDIVRDEADRWRFLRMLFLLNDKNFKDDWTKMKLEHLFSRPAHWQEREPIVDVLAYTLMSNHVHLILKEKNEGGVTLFMKRLGQSMTNHANEKYSEKGSLWQGAYRSRTIGDDRYFRYVVIYVMVKNTFELYPEGGLEAARDNFEKVWDWAINYNFSSLGDYVGKRAASSILNKEDLSEIFSEPEDLKRFAYNMIMGKLGEVIPMKDLE